MREKLIEINALMKEKTFLWDEALGFCECVLVDDIDKMPTVELVRCKDCEKWQRHTQVDRERGHCRRFDMTKHESGFCDRGERRTDDNN